MSTEAKVLKRLIELLQRQSWATHRRAELEAMIADLEAPRLPPEGRQG